MSAHDTRELTPKESKALAWLEKFDELAGWSRDVSPTAVQKFTYLYMTKEAVETIASKQIARASKIEFDGARGMYRVYFLLGEFRKYVEFLARNVGLKVELDGTVRTFDGYKARAS